MCFPGATICLDSKLQLLSSISALGSVGVVTAAEGNSGVESTVCDEMFFLGVIICLDSAVKLMFFTKGLSLEDASSMLGLGSIRDTDTSAEGNSGNEGTVFDEMCFLGAIICLDSTG
mmetsp:Transcript_13440/g.18625  ORF Transcript_13440/g.18625 Transcript_13440/m.18625 type:complete len:117 (-) Transcript_13440:223-573(-)